MPRKFDRQKFSEKMLTGFEQVGRHQAEGELIVLATNNRSAHSACALGAAALGHRVPIKDLRDEINWWPKNTELPPAICPLQEDASWNLVDCEHMRRLDSVITHLNDDHWWSIPNIARWVADPSFRPTNPRSE